MINRLSCGAGLIGGIACLMLMTAGCGKKADRAIRQDLAEKVVIVTTVVQEASPPATGWPAWLASRLTAAAFYSQHQLGTAIQLCLEQDKVLLLSDNVELNSDSISALNDYLDRGGRLLDIGIRTAPDADMATRITSPTTLIPPRTMLTSSTFRIMSSRKNIDTASRVIAGLTPSPPGIGGESADDARWIPVVSALSSGQNIAGFPAAVYLNPQTGGIHSIRGWFGLNPTRHEGEAFTEMFEAVLEEMSREIYLIRYGAEYHSVISRAPTRISARVLDRRTRDTAPLRLAAEWINRNGIEIRRHVSAPFDTLATPMVLNTGLAPDVPGNPELYTLRILLRDRNDQRTHDQSDQVIKVFAENNPPSERDPISAQTGRLVQGRHPVFMLGVNYWPRHMNMKSAGDGTHWLDAIRFDPATLQADLDLIQAAGINSIALEYTELSQAPQLLFVLDELRRRSLWAIIYIPALHPLDLRIDEGLRMLNAVKLSDWPEVFGIELARGLGVRTAQERRHLDKAWREWIDEHYNSIIEAEQKLGVTLWRERGRVSGPPDRQTSNGPHRDPAIALYFSFLRDYASRNIGYTRQILREQGYNQLLTARSAYSWPDREPPGILDTLDISVGTHHLDIMFPDAWSFHPLRQERPDSGILYAYARGLSGGKPVMWSEYGHHVGSALTAQSSQRQKEVYKFFIDTFIEQGASGAFSWWFPPGPSARAELDWGMVNPDGTWRPVEEVFRSSRLLLRRNRPRQTTVSRENASLIQSAKQWRDMQQARSGMFADRADGATAVEWMPPGTGMEASALLNPRGERRWSEIDGLTMLNSEWGVIAAGGNNIPRAPGESVRTYTGRQIEMELINSGTVRWSQAGERINGSVWLRASQAGHADEWITLTPSHAGGRQRIRWTPREPGIWDLQAFLVGYGRFGERLRIEATSPPRLF
ncbi:MAG TPA: hypothetical protein PJ991_04590 [Kiritimatiellia bacterium]|nr:hypothetical protein [Kiritimatiellia bacterium]